MRKTLGILLIISGALVILISIMGLVRAFEIFKVIGSDSESLSYVFGSILFPLLLTVVGRWIYRKGTAILREKKAL